jgi:hypothetical protein
MTSETEELQTAEVEVRDSRIFFGGFATLLWLIAGGFASLGGGFGWLFAGVTAAKAVWASWRFLAGAVRLRITEEGVTDHTFWFSPGFIDWGDILDVREAGFGLLDLRLRDPGSVWDRLPPLAQIRRFSLRRGGLGPATLYPPMLRGSSKELVHTLRVRVDAEVLSEVRAARELPAPPPAIPEEE